MEYFNTLLILTWGITTTIFYLYRNLYFKVVFVKISKTILYQDKIEIFSKLKYEMVKIRMRNIPRFLLNCLLIFFGIY